MAIFKVDGHKANHIKHITQLFLPNLCFNILIIMNAPVLKTLPAFLKHMLYCMNFFLLPWKRYLFQIGSSLKGKNLLLEEQVLSFKS